MKTTVSGAFFRHPLTIALFVGLGITIVVGAALLYWERTTFRVSVIDPGIPAADFSGYDSQGNFFQLSQQRGKVVLLYFGFLNCPDECPLTLAHLKVALEALGSKAQDVQMIMVSTDPIRDTPQIMNEYLAAFNPTFLGLTGSPDAMATIYDAYHVVVLDGGETHSSFTYVIDRKGNLRLTFLPDTPAEDIAHDLKIILSED